MQQSFFLVFKRNFEKLHFASAKTTFLQQLPPNNSQSLGDQ
jgi:hypothetical protein